MGFGTSAVYLPQLRPDEASTTGEDEEHRLLRLRQEFVGRTRARDRLWVGTVQPPSNP